MLASRERKKEKKQNGRLNDKIRIRNPSQPSYGSSDDLVPPHTIHATETRDVLVNTLRRPALRAGRSHQATGPIQPARFHNTHRRASSSPPSGKPTTPHTTDFRAIGLLGPTALLFHLPSNIWHLNNTNCSCPP